MPTPKTTTTPTTHTGAPRFVELVRVSTQAQADRDTPEVQRSALDRLRVSRPGVLVERIEALGVSGGLGMRERPDLQRLAALAGERAFDEVRLYALDRLTRHEDPRERFALYGLALDAGAALVDASGRTIDPADPSGMGEMEFTLYGFFSARERAKIKQRTMAGRERAAAAGRSISPRVPFARFFDRASKTWRVNEEQAAVYRRIFDLALAGRSTREIALTLNREGVPTPRQRGQWGTSAITGLLHARAAVGEWSQMGHPVAIPAIIDAATLERVERLLTERKVTGSGRPAKWHPLLARAARCGLCGHALYLAGNHYRAGVWYGYYRCGRGWRWTIPGPRPLCWRYLYRTSTYDAAVKLAVRGLLDNPALLLATADAQAQQADTAPAEAHLAEARRDLARLPVEEERLARVYRRGLLSDEAFEAQAAEIATHRRELDAQIRRLTLQLAGAAQREQLAGDVAARLGAIRARLDRATDAEWNQIVRALTAEGGGVAIHPDGRVAIDGVIAADDPVVEPPTMLARSAQINAARVLPFSLSVAVPPPRPRGGAR